MDEKKEAIFPKGIFCDRPKDGAPEFIKAKIAIKVDEAITFLETYKNQRGYVNLDLKKSREGKLYLQLNTFVADLKRPEGYTPDVGAPSTDGRADFGELSDIKIEETPF